MISFLRKIRKQLLSENRLTKYLLYALGEIVLVVLGILIALRINTYNKELQNCALEKASLENLIDDLKVQKEIIQAQLDYETEKLMVLDSCRSYFESKIPNTDLYRLLTRLTSRKTFVNQTVTYDNLVATGNIMLIRDADLMDQIARYYNGLEYTKSVVNNNNLFLVDSQFGAFVANNRLGFRMLDNGVLDESYELSPESKFTLKSQLHERTMASGSIKDISLRQLKVTAELITLLENKIAVLE